MLPENGVIGLAGLSGDGTSLVTT